MFTDCIDDANNVTFHFVNNFNDSYQTTVA